MRILIVLILPFVIITACRNSEKGDREGNKRVQSSGDSNAANKDSINRKADRSYTWTKKEKNKFLKECEAGAEYHLTGEKLKDFCACLLLHSQEYYQTYDEMERKSDEADDASILAACADFLDDDDE